MGSSKSPRTKQAKPLKMSREELRDLRERFSDFDAVWAFVKKHKLPTCACSIRAWVCEDEDDIPWGYSDMEEKVAQSICRARMVYEQQVRDPGGVDKLRVRSQGDTVLVYANGSNKLISLKPMTPKEIKHVYDTQKYRDVYRYFDQSLEFVHRHKLPTCKCAVFSDHGNRTASMLWGYSASAEQVAAALSLTWEIHEESIEAAEVDRLESFLWAEQTEKATKVFIEDFMLLELTPLTPAQILEAKSQWIEHTLAARKESKSTKKVSRDELSKRDPFKSGKALFDYMPDGKLHWKLKNIIEE